MSSDRSRHRHLVERVVGIIRANADQTDRLDQLASARFGLNRTDGRALEVLRRLGPMTANKLAASLGMTTGGVTTVIDRLEQAGYVVRRHDKDDRRRVLVEATDHAAQREGEIFGPLIKKTAELVSGYRDSELQLIGDFLERLGAAVSTHANGLEGSRARRRARR